jgi:hypothetical protein
VADRGTILLNGLLSQLRGWFDTIRRATYAKELTVLPLPDGEFTIRVTWQPKDGAEKHFDKTFTRKDMFGASYGHSPMAWRVERRACDHARDLMRAVLAEQGVL